MAAGKNLHLEHLEDEILNLGTEGGKQAIKVLKEMGNMLSGSPGPKPMVTTKFDGAPAIICGTDPSDGKFFVGTKSVFAKTAPKICKTESDVKSMYDGELASKLSDALRYLKDAKIKGVLQGDLMFTSDKQNKQINGKNFIIFRPNTITYAVEPNSPLGKKISSSKLGIVFHTKYTGDSLPDMTSSFKIDKGDFSSTNQVWAQKAEFNDISGASSMTNAERSKFNSAVNRADGSLRQAGNILNLIQSGKKTLQVDTEFKKFFNRYVRDGQSIPSVERAYRDFMYHMGKEYDKVISKNKTLKAQADKAGKFMDTIDFLEKNERQIKMLIASYMNIQYAKNLLVKKLEKVSDLHMFVDKGNGNYEVTVPEGFVAVNEKGAVKLIDRLNFAVLNFTLPKSFGK